MVSENDLVNAPKVCQPVNIRIKGIKEIRSKTRRLRLVESVTFFGIGFSSTEDSHLHETFFLIPFLACSQSYTVALPVMKASPRSLSTFHTKPVI